MPIIFNSYSLSDTAYGLYLIYKDLQPYYIFDVFDGDNFDFKRITEQQNINSQVLLKKILSVSGSNLELQENVFLKIGVGETTVENIDVLKLPPDLLRPYLQSLEYLPNK